MPASTLLAQAQASLWLVVAVSLPFVAVAALVGMFVAALQAATQLQDATIAHLPRLLAVCGALAVLGPWAGHQIATFAQQMLLLAAR